MSSSPTIDAFLRWWGGELLRLVPKRLREAVVPPRITLEVEATDGEARLALVGPDGLSQVRHLPLRDAREVRAAARRLAGEADETVLRLPPGQILRPRLRLPLEAAADLRAALAAEMDRRTPFHADAVYFDWRVTGSDLESGWLRVDAVVARREDVRTALERTSPLGLAFDRLDGPGDGEGYNLLPPERRRKRRRLSRLLPPLAVLAAVLLLAWGALAWQARRADLAALDARLAALRSENADVAAMEERLVRLVDERDRLLRRKIEDVGALELLAELTELVPDGDWLFALSFEEGEVRLEGFSREASRLPERLEASPLLEDVSFGAPVIREAEDGLERFRIEARVVSRAGE